MKRSKLLAMLLLLMVVAMPAMAQTTLFETVEGQPPYRIPAIATAKNGDVIALSDYRPCYNDIGYGRVDIKQRVSKDNGKTWGEMTEVLTGTGEGLTTGFGDACLVADRNKNELLLVCVAGNQTYWASSLANPQHIVTIHAYLDKKTGEWVWDKQFKDHTLHIYHTLLHDKVRALFMGSGRICQSSRVKVGKYYRVYGALCTHEGNFVLYSDDFGRNWNVLGDSYNVCVPKGDEPKCEELPNGDVLISSRKDGGRYFNIFHYTDKKTAEGQWDKCVDSRECKGGISNSGTPTDGEIMILPWKKEGKRCHVALQSIPAGPQRSNVTIYYKYLESEADYSTPLAFASEWDGEYQVSHKGSAYSTMTLQKDGSIGFYYEEEPQYYQMVYKNLKLEEILSGGKL